MLAGRTTMLGRRACLMFSCPAVGRLRALTSSSALEKHGGVALVQGASRGLGLEFVRQLLNEYASGQVVATCRHPQAAEKLLALKKQHHDRLTVAALDVTDEGSIHAAADLISGEFGRLDLLVNTAGLLHIPGVLHPETSLSKLEPEALIRTFQVNAAGPILVTKHMWPLLKAGGGRNTSRASAVVANLSARVSSIGDNQLGGWYSYRASKTALNQLTKCAALEFARRKDPISCILLHPGTVDTDLSKPFQRNVPQGKLFSVPYSVGKLMEIIDRVDVKDNGKFFAWDGQQIPCENGMGTFVRFAQRSGTVVQIGAAACQSRPVASLAAEGKWEPQRLPRAAIVRGVPDSFSSCLTMERPSEIIDVALARKQHANYVRILRGLVQEVIELPSENSYPDCPFVEDTAIVVGSRAFVTRPGAVPRRGEVAAVRSALTGLSLEVFDIGPSGVLDGGDVLFAGGTLFVGRSKRTNEEGIKALASAFSDIPVVPIDVPMGLHLKSALSTIGWDVLAVEDTPSGHCMLECIRKAKQFEAIPVATSGAANTLRIGETLLYPSAYGRGKWEQQYRTINKEVIPVDISEFHKGDGGLTCLSIIIP